jgi:hypothetical protein
MAHANGAPPYFVHAQYRQQLDRGDADLAALEEIQKRIETLSQPELSGSLFKEKLKTTVRRSGKTMKIQILKLRQKRLLRKLGRLITEEQIAENSLAAETGEVKAASQKLRSLDAEIQTLAGQTYVWARRPLLTGSIALALTILFAGIAYEQELATPDTSTPRKAAIAFVNALSANDMKLARSLAIGSESELTAAKAYYDFSAALARSLGAEARKFGDAAEATKFDNSVKNDLESAREEIDGDTAGLVAFTLARYLRKTAGNWKIDLTRGSLPTAAGLSAMSRMTTSLNELANDIEKGRYKTRKESKAEFEKITEAVWKDWASPSPSASASATPQQADTSAVAKLRQAADAGDVGAMRKLGVLYEEGEGVAKDLNEAARWYRKAADAGDATAMRNLGVIYSKGEGVAKDLSEAARWYRKAADAGNAEAMFNLGLDYSKGEGVASRLLPGSKVQMFFSVTQNSLSPSDRVIPRRGCCGGNWLGEIVRLVCSVRLISRSTCLLSALPMA